MSQQYFLFCLALGYCSAAAPLLGQVDNAAVQIIAMSELQGANLPTTARFCLTVPESHPSSDHAGDPSGDLLAYLARAGLRPSRASACYKALSGNVVVIRTMRRSGRELSAEVDLVNARVAEDSHFATLLRRGTYNLLQTQAGKWSVRSYTAAPDVKPETPK